LNTSLTFSRVPFRSSLCRRS